MLYPGQDFTRRDGVITGTRLENRWTHITQYTERMDFLASFQFIKEISEKQFKRKDECQHFIKKEVLRSRERKTKKDCLKDNRRFQYLQKEKEFNQENKEKMKDINPNDKIISAKQEKSKIQDQAFLKNINMKMTGNYKTLLPFLGSDPKVMKIFDAQTLTIKRAKIKEDVSQSQIHIMLYKVYLIGGQELSTGETIDGMRSYDLLLEKWEKLESIPDGGRCYCGTASFIIQGFSQIIVVGGLRGMEENAIKILTYDTKKKNWDWMGNLKQSRQWPAVWVAFQTLFVFGGSQDDQNGFAIQVNTYERIVLSPYTGSSQVRKSGILHISQGQRHLPTGGSATSFEGKILIFGGFYSQSQSKPQIFDPDTQQFSFLQDKGQSSNKIYEVCILHEKKKIYAVEKNLTGDAQIKCITLAEQNELKFEEVPINYSDIFLL